jgi:hypothetical protein
VQVDANGTRLWFDVEGAALVPDGREMRERPTAVLPHGGPGSFDHSGDGHFPWMDVPETYWPLINGFVSSA